MTYVYGCKIGDFRISLFVQGMHLEQFSPIEWGCKGEKCFSGLYADKAEKVKCSDSGS